MPTEKQGKLTTHDNTTDTISILMAIFRDIAINWMLSGSLPQT